MRKMSCVSILSLLAFIMSNSSVYATSELGQVVIAKRVVAKKLNQVIDKTAEKLWREDLLQVPDPLAGDALSNIVGHDIAQAFAFPNVLQQMVLQYVTNPGERCVLAAEYADPEKSKEIRAMYRAHQLEKIKLYLPNFIELLPVTSQDVAHLQLARVQTSITQPMAGFLGAEVKNSIGLYFTTMRVYPNLRVCMFATQSAATYAAWKANPDLPLIYTTSAEDVIFADRLSRLTGRKFTIMSDPQNEYMRRGRTGDTAETSAGSITTTRYHFGNNDDEVKNHAFIRSNPLTQGRIHGVHEIPLHNPDGSAINPNDYKNARGFIHPIGLAYERSPDGMLCGGSFQYSEETAQSSYLSPGHGYYLDTRSVQIASRLAEVL